MHLVVVTDSFHPREGGAERQLRQVGAALVADHDWEVSVVARRLGDLPGRARLDGVAVHRVGARGSGRCFTAAATATAARTAAATRPDVLVAIQLGASAVAAVSASRLARRSRPPVVVRVTGGLADGTELERCGRGPVRRAAFAAVLGGCDAIVAPARHLLDRPGPFGSAVGERGLVIPNGAPSSAPSVHPRTSVVWIGRSAPEKRLDLLLAVAAGNAELDHVVVGPEPADLPDGAPPNLRATGWVTDPSVELDRAAVCVSTSDFEGHPNAALEALQSGVPVVAWDIAAFRELRGQVPGLVDLVPPGDVDRMAAAVRNRVRSTGQGPAEAGRLPTVADAAAHWDALLRDLVAGVPPRRAVEIRG